MNQPLKNGLFILGVVILGGVVTSSVVAARASDIQADNTRKNIRDRQLSAMTPLDQSNDLNDMAITQDIRKMLMKEKDLSMDAKNIKVITRNRIATLRGPVDSLGEKAVVEQIARVVAGLGKVNNQVEVITK